MPMLDMERIYLVYCHTDSASILGAQKLVNAGFMHVYRLKGNCDTGMEVGYTVEKGGETSDSW